MPALHSIKRSLLRAVLLVTTLPSLTVQLAEAASAGPPAASGSIPSMDARSRPDGFGTAGIAGPVIQLGGRTGQLVLTASGTWCRNGSGACSGPAGDVLVSPSGPLPGEAYNQLGGEWIGGMSDGARFVVGAGAELPIPVGSRAVQLFFNDDLGAHGDNVGTISVVWTVEALEGVAPRPLRNPDGEWGVPQNTLTIPAPPTGQGLYLINIQAS